MCLTSFKPMVRGWKPTEDPKEKHVMEIRQFAVTEYNKRSKSVLKPWEYFKSLSSF